MAKTHVHGPLAKAHDALVLVLLACVVELEPHSVQCLATPLDLLLDSLVHDGNGVATVVREAVEKVVHVVRLAPVVLDACQVTLQEVLLLHLLVPWHKMRKTGLVLIHAIDLANKEVPVFAGVLQGHFQEMPLVQYPLQMLLLHALSDSSIDRVLVVPRITFAATMPLIG